MNGKKLYKISDEGKIMGVCAGLADYFDLDVSLVRIIVAIIGISSGVGFIAYFIMGFILPEKYEVM